MTEVKIIRTVMFCDAAVSQIKKTRGEEEKKG